MRIKIDFANKSKIQSELEKINGRAHEHTFNEYWQVQALAELAEDKLIDILPANVKKGSVYTCTSGKRIGRSYSYSRKATKLTFERGERDWFLINVEAVQVGTNGGDDKLFLTSEQNVIAEERATRRKKDSEKRQAALTRLHAEYSIVGQGAGEFAHA